MHQAALHAERDVAEGLPVDEQVEVVHGQRLERVLHGLPRRFSSAPFLIAPGSDAEKKTRERAAEQEASSGRGVVEAVAVAFLALLLLLLSDSNSMGKIVRSSHKNCKMKR